MVRGSLLHRKRKKPDYNKSIVVVVCVFVLNRGFSEGNTLYVELMGHFLIPTLTAKNIREFCLCLHFLLSIIEESEKPIQVISSPPHRHVLSGRVGSFPRRISCRWRSGSSLLPTETCSFGVWRSVAFIDSPYHTPTNLPNLPDSLCPGNRRHLVYRQ